MSAVCVTGPLHVELVESRPPDRPLGSKEVAGSTLASLISPGTELNWCYLATEFPRYPGYSAVFEVETVGAEVTGLAPGDVAFCMGPHRSWQRVPAADALKLPAGLAPAVAVWARLLNVPWSTLATTVARPPEQVLVTGLGPVGHLAAQLFQASGYRVLGVDPSPARRALAAGKGLATAPACPLDDPAWEQHVGVALECSGHEQAALDCVRMVRKRGEVVQVATPWVQRTDLAAHTLLHAIFHRYAVLRSGWEWEIPNHPRDFVGNSLFGQMAAGLAWLQTGRIDVAGLAECVPPSACGEAYARLQAQAVEGLSLVFDWTLS